MKKDPGGSDRESKLLDPGEHFQLLASAPMPKNQRALTREIVSETIAQLAIYAADFFVNRWEGEQTSRHT